MSIKRIEVRNFKSFEELKIDPGKFNVIIGANASGKSNFVHIFEFLRDITSSGLNNAISMQGGVEYLRNMNIGASEPLSIKVVFDPGFEWLGWIKGIKTYEVIYEFALRFNKRGSGFRIVKDELRQKCKFLKLKLERKGKKLKKKFLAREKLLSHVVMEG